MRIGFTGTQRGLTGLQSRKLNEMLAKYYVIWTADLWLVQELHHGDCVGADAEAAGLARKLGYRLVCHPPRRKAKRAFVASDETRPPRNYLDRNHAIVAECELLFACPKEFLEVRRSGTWATVREARLLKRNLYIICPDGSVRPE